jgi:hypothetical protein
MIIAWLKEETRRYTTRAERVLGAHRWLTLWILDWAKRGTPGPMFKEARGWVGTGRWRLRKGKYIPMVWAVAGPTSDPEAMATEFLRQCKAAFPEETWVNKETPKRDARWFRQSKEGMPDAEIDAVSPKEESWSGANTVKQARRRWKRQIRGVTRSVTQIRRSK